MAFWANLTLIALFTLLSHSSDARYIRSLDEGTRVAVPSDKIADDSKEVKNSIDATSHASEQVPEALSYGVKEQAMEEVFSEREEKTEKAKEDEVIEDREDDEDGKYSQEGDALARKEPPIPVIKEDITHARESPSKEIVPEEETVTKMIAQEKETYQSIGENLSEMQHLAREVELSDAETVADTPLETESFLTAQENRVELETIDDEIIESNAEQGETDLLEEIEEQIEEQLEQTLQSEEEVIEDRNKQSQYLLWYISPEEAVNHPSSRVVIPRIQFELPFELNERFQEMNNAFSEQLTELQKTLTNFFQQFTQRN